MVAAGGYGGGGSIGDPTRFPRYMSASSTKHISPPPPPPPPYMYPSPPPPSSSYYVGHVLHNYGGEPSSAAGYTCIGAPVGQGFIGKDSSLHNNNNQDDALNWGRTYSAINRFHQDGF